MTTDKPKIAILGAGAVGCFLGGCWHAAGLPITLIGRQTVADDIRENGLTVSDHTGWHLGPSRVDFRTEPDALGDSQIIALTVKSGATTKAASDIVRCAPQGALVISFQNGISNVEVLRRELPDRFQVVRGMVPYNVAYLGRGRFHKGVSGILHAENTSELRALSNAIGGGPAALALSEDMIGLGWGKLLINLNNAVNALSGRSLLDQLRQRDYRRVLAASQREGLQLLRQARIRPAKIGTVGPKILPILISSPDWLFRSIFMKSWRIDANARSSMSDDLAAGRKTEIDYINGELIALAERLGQPVLINRKIVELIRKAEAGAPPWSPKELRREVLGR